MTPTQPTFDGLGIAPKILEILDRLKFISPTPIQHQSIPPALLGKDLMGIAQTGTGKTLAFGIPMIQRLAQQGGKGLIILPTRELALQVDESINKIGRPLGLKTAILIGGENMGKQIRQLRFNPHIVIATPGRLIDHLEQKTVKLDNVKILVLDEADHMLDMGFAPQIKKILVTVPKERQTMLFSATMPPEIVSIANSYMALPVRVEVAPAGTATANVTQEVYFVQREQKLNLLENILKEYKGSVLVFCRTKFGAKKVAAIIRRMGITSNEIHSNRSLSQRLEALSGFKLGKYRVLVATDIAARGIDVTGIEVVVNFDLPEQASDYVHRIGRTGRAAHVGHAISFATPDQKFDVRSIERLIKKQLPIAKLPEMTALKLTPEVFSASNPPRHTPRQNRYSSRSNFTPGKSNYQNNRPAFSQPPFQNLQTKPEPVYNQANGFKNKGHFKPFRKPFEKPNKIVNRFKKSPGLFGNYRDSQKPRFSKTDDQF